MRVRPDARTRLAVRRALLVPLLLAGLLAAPAQGQSRATPVARLQLGADVYRVGARYDDQAPALRDEGFGVALRGGYPLSGRELVVTAEFGAASVAAGARGRYTLAHAEAGVQTAFEPLRGIVPFLGVSAVGLRTAPEAVARYGGGVRFASGVDLPLGRGVGVRGALVVTRAWLAPATSAAGRPLPTSDFRGTQLRLGLTLDL